MKLQKVANHTSEAHRKDALDQLGQKHRSHRCNVNRPHGHNKVKNKHVLPKHRNAFFKRKLRIDPMQNIFHPATEACPLDLR